MGPIADPIGERSWRPTTRPALLLALLSIPLLAVAGIVLEQRQPELPPVSPLPAVFPTSSAAASYPAPTAVANPWGELAASHLPMMMLPTAPGAPDKLVAPTQPFMTAAVAPLLDAPAAVAATEPSIVPATKAVGSRVEAPAPPVAAEPSEPQAASDDAATAASEEREQQLLRGERHDADGSGASTSAGPGDVAANTGPAANLAAALAIAGPRVAVATPTPAPAMSPLELLARQAATADAGATVADPVAQDPSQRAVDAGLVHKAPDPSATADANAGKDRGLGGATSHAGAKDGGGHQ